MSDDTKAGPGDPAVPAEAVQATLVRLLQTVVLSDLPQVPPSLPAEVAVSGSVPPLPADAAEKLARLQAANEALLLDTLPTPALQAAAALALAHQQALVAAVADELRNPEAPIHIVAAMLGHPATDALLPKIRHIAEEQLMQTVSQVAQLLEVSRREVTGVVVQRQGVDMGQVIDAAIATHAPAMAQHHQAFESSRPAGRLPVWGDAQRLEQIVSSLLDNACRHTLPGGHIRLRVVVDQQVLALTVADDGIGITPELLPLVFEPFVQDTHALGLKNLGLGIGLTVVRALVRAHGGDLVAHSAGTRRGSQFVVRLPLAGDNGGVADAEHRP